jgi:hypothetical protein
MSLSNPGETEKNLQAEVNRLKKQRNMLMITAGGMFIPAVMQIFTWLFPPVPMAKDYDEPVIPGQGPYPAAFSLADSVQNYRDKYGTSTKTYIVAYKPGKAQTYHNHIYDSIIRANARLITSPEMEWRICFYPWLERDSLKLAIMPGLVRVDATTREIVEIYDYFDRNTRSATYQNADIVAYDFGHLKP